MSNLPVDLSKRRVFVAGHRGMVGSAIVRRLENEGCEILSVDRSHVDLTRQDQVDDWFNKHRPEYVFLAAAKVGGILANSRHPADFLIENLLIETNVIGSAARHSTRKLLFLGSSCIYPKFSIQPIPESELLQGQLEPTNEWYAIAKIAGIKLCQAFRKQCESDFISAMPANLYGPNDNFDTRSSHVLPALIRKFSEAKTRGDGFVEVWGTGTPLREFLHVDDCADGLVFLMKNYSEYEHINIGSGLEITIIALAKLIAEEIGFQGEIRVDPSMPDGTPRKLMDSSRIQSMGWKPAIGLKEGIRRTLSEYQPEN